MTWFTFLITTHVFGTILGVGGATFAEIFYLKALRDGEIDPTENSFLKITYRVLRVGLVILIFSGVGIFILGRLTGHESSFYDPRFLAKMTMFAAILINPILFQTKLLKSWLATSVSLVSWYGAFILGMWRSLETSYIQIMIVYIVAIIITAVILEMIKRMIKIT